eukprot:1875535-Prymnesium_polylepis.1
MSDPSHWVKKIVTHWEKSASGSMTRELRIPDHLVQMILERCPPPAPLVRPGPERGETTGIECYCRVMGRLYVLLAASGQPFYRTSDPARGPRLQEIRDILTWVREWHSYNAQLPRLTPKERAARGFSHQLLWDTNMMIE